MAKHCKERSWEDLDLTRDEVEKLGEALKKEEFRKLLLEYAEEINDPENKKQYEKEITELEKERGIDVTFINPEPCYVIKSSVDGEKKAFLNICKNDKVGKPTSVPVTKSGARGLNWSLPYTQAPPREDLDKNGNRCTVFDVVFHPDTHHLAENNIQFKQMLNNTALDAVEDNFDVHIDRKNLKYPKMKYKGSPRPTVIRRKIENAPSISKDNFSIPESVYPYRSPEEGSQLHAKHDQISKRQQVADTKISNEVESQYAIPKYIIKHRRPIDIQDYSNDLDAKMNATVPKELVIEVQLPLLKSSSDMILDVTLKSISLKSEKPAKYKLDLSLPYPVNEDAGSAKFDQKLRILVITLPVRRDNNINLADTTREDSGVESDAGRRSHDSSSDDDDGKTSNNTVFELQSQENSIPEVIDDDAYRTMKESINSFLNPNVDYLFPNFTCNVIDSDLAFTLHVKNVEPDSIKYCFWSEEFSGVHLCFSSIGSGFFPIHYAFCLKFPSCAVISEETFCAEAWDNNVIVQMHLETSDIEVEYYAGVDQGSLMKYDLHVPAALGKKLEQLEIEALSTTSESDLKVEVTKYSEEELIVEIHPDKSKTKLDDDDDEDDNEEEEENSSESYIAETSDHCNGASSDPDICVEETKVQKPQKKFRTLSESSWDELGLSPTKKGILKNCGRVCRSLSESSVDDYVWSSSLDMVTQSGSESCIPEEDEEREMKKTVRFNEVVSKKTYRTNSSILGQRKKNQRKTRNKKRCQERRASESENSEGEVEREREREKKTFEVSAADTSLEDSHSKKASNDDSDSAVPESGEIDADVSDDSKDISATSPQTNGRVQQLTDEQTPSKGRKRNRKGAGSVSINSCGSKQLEFGSDLIFDLDM